MAQKSAIYLAYTAFFTCTKIVAVPIMVAVLSPSDYGKLSLALTLFGTVTMITFMSMRPPVVRQLAINTGRENARYVSSAIALIIGLTAILAIAAALFENPATHIFRLPLTLIEGLVLLGGAQSVYQVYLAVIQAKDQAKYYSALQSSFALANLAMTLAFLFILKFGWPSQALSYVICAVAGCAVAIAGIKRLRLFDVPRLEYAQELFGLGIAVVPAFLFINTVDRMLLGASFTPGDVGLYTLAQQIGAVVSFFASAVMLALTPWAFREMSECRSRADWARVTRSLGLVAAVIIAVVAIFGIAVIAGASSFGSWRYVQMITYFPWLLGGSGFLALYQVFALPLYFRKRARLLGVSGALAASTGLVMAVVLPRFFGPVGIAMAVCAGRFLQFAFVLVTGLHLGERGSGERRSE